MSDQRRALGAAGEDAVAEWYTGAGYEVVDRNWRCRDGEIDLVVTRGRLIVVCEVKTRRTDAFGAPAEAVTASKQRRLRTLAVQWLGERGCGGDLRFDVASVRPGRGRLEVEVLEGAF
ncbi:MAG TPA: YraN family protein [Acidimicrobiia bacterium]|nr:YraN family protein [Acidimicrobiia bacterium]